MVHKRTSGWMFFLRRRIFVRTQKSNIYLFQRLLGYYIRNVISLNLRIKKAKYFIIVDVRFLFKVKDKIPHFYFILIFLYFGILFDRSLLIKGRRIRELLLWYLFEYSSYDSNEDYRIELWLRTIWCPLHKLFLRV
jgi:hypothetical protein